MVVDKNTAISDIEVRNKPSCWRIRWGVTTHSNVSVPGHSQELHSPGWHWHHPDQSECGRDGEPSSDHHQILHLRIMSNNNLSKVSCKCSPLGQSQLIFFLWRFSIFKSAGASCSWCPFCPIACHTWDPKQGQVSLVNECYMCSWLTVYLNQSSLEFFSFSSPYDANKDSILRRAKGMFSAEDMK